MNQDHITNHFLEGWHQESSIVGVNHPDIYKFLSKLSEEQAHTEMGRREIRRGEDTIKPPLQKRTVISINKLLLAAVLGFVIKNRWGQYINNLLAFNILY